MSLIEAARKQATDFAKMARQASMISGFGFNRKSVAYLDTFIDRQAGGLKRDPNLRARIVSAAGCFLGEAIIATYGGKWIEMDGGLMVQIEQGDQFHALTPHGKIEKRIMNGEEDNIKFYFGEFIPAILAGKAPEEWKIEPKMQALRKPWWKFW